MTSTRRPVVNLVGRSESGTPHAERSGDYQRGGLDVATAAGIASLPFRQIRVSDTKLTDSGDVMGDTIGGARALALIESSDLAV